MVYRGSVRNGVVVFEGDSPPLQDGTEVRVEPVSAGKTPAPSTPEAILHVLRTGGTWEGDPGEWDRMLAELKEDKWAEVRAEQDREPETL